LKFILFLYCLLSAFFSFAQTDVRSVTNINPGWQFKKNNELNESATWQNVDLPHTWNVADVMDDEPGYYRGKGLYKKKLSLDKALLNKELFLFFEGANQVAEIFINGKKAGEHIGGYSGFYVPITQFVNFSGENELLVKLDNSHNQNIPPLSADFTFYGGVYRDVWLVAVNRVHFTCNRYGSNSVYINTPVVDQKMASVKIASAITNDEPNSKQVKINSIVYDKTGKKIVAISSMKILVPGVDSDSIEQTININNPKLWSPETPYLYTVITEIRDAVSNKLLDVLTNPLGLRWFHFDAGKGFYLNGKQLKLIGTSRHQDYKGIGNAVPDSLAWRDVALIKEMGGNFLRVSHYPQDPSVLKACDELGILASVEIPVVNEITESDSFYNNCEVMQVEMIRQNYNHPSVIMWCYMNEVLLRPQFKDNKGRQKLYYASIAKLAKRLDSITRKEDPYRYTMIAHPGDFNRYRDAGLIDIPMLVGWNLYSGWYGANLSDFPVFLDRFHTDYPNKPMMVTEYGADADPRIRSTEPVRFDKSVEYATGFHQYYYKEIMKRPFVTAAMVWNLADFNSETRNESMPHMNNKGLLEWDRKPKDPYYYYKAMLTKKPFVKILGDLLRGGMADSGKIISYQILQVAGNVDKMELTINGKLPESKKIENGIGEWRLPFINGANSIDVRSVKNGKMVTDHAIINFKLQGYELTDTNIPFTELNILLGANRSFVDSSNQLWQPDQLYRKGSWGHIGGKAFGLINNGRLPYGTDKNILGTCNDPIYQTQQTGITAYHFDVLPGNYELTLYFAELQGGIVKSLPYNLSDTTRNENTAKRIFNVAVNDIPLLQNFNMQKDYGAATAISKKTAITVVNNKGIIISFAAIEGEPVLNAVQLKKAGSNDNEFIKTN
jgi:beta-galactosidase